MSTRHTFPPARAFPIFIVANTHSGTYMLKNILGNNSNVFQGLRETGFFAYFDLFQNLYSNILDDESLHQFVEFVVDLIYNGENINDYDRSDFEMRTVRKEDIDVIFQLSKSFRDHVDIFRIANDHLALSEDKSFWIEKTTTHIMHIDQILARIPDAKIVEIVRDPRGPLASKKKRAQRGAELYDIVLDTLAWKTAIRAGMKANEIYSDKVYTVRYEDILENPKGEIIKLCEFLGLDFDVEMLDIPVTNTAEGSERDSQRGIQRTSAYKWKTVLTNSEIYICQTLAGDEMQYHGYNFEQTRFRDVLAASWLYIKSLVNIFLRIWGKLKRNNPRLLINTLKNYYNRLHLVTKKD